MTTTDWATPVTNLTTRLGPGLPALWTVLTVTEIATLQLACAIGGTGGSDRDLTEAAWDLAEAREELEWARPDLAATGLTVALPDPDPGQVLAYRAELAGLVRGALALLTQLHEQHEPADTDEVLALARATALLGSAHTRLVGRLP